MPNCCEHCKVANDDHDLLIAIHTDLKNFVKTLFDHEKRLRRTEMWGFVAIGGLFVAQIVMGLYFTAKFAKP